MTALSSLEDLKRLASELVALIERTDHALRFRVRDPGVYPTCSAFDLVFHDCTSTWENLEYGCLVTIALASNASVCEFSIAAPDASALSSQSVGSVLERLRDTHGVIVQP